MFIIEVISNFPGVDYYSYKNEEQAKKNAKILAERGYKVTLYKAVAEYKKTAPPVEEVPL